MSETVNSNSRRKFVKTAGKLAIYTPPALMLMSQTSTAIARSACHTGGFHGGGGRHGGGAFNFGGGRHGGHRQGGGRRGGGRRRS